MEAMTLYLPVFLVSIHLLAVAVCYYLTGVPKNVVPPPYILPHGALKVNREVKRVAGVSGVNVSVREGLVAGTGKSRM
jgi:hypothetical protein